MNPTGLAPSLPSATAKLRGLFKVPRTNVPAPGVPRDRSTWTERVCWAHDTTGAPVFTRIVKLPDAGRGL
ncbi:Uncharacterised protein [Mycobacteroides abscessus subsp. abscessus]|nr:Uncharacterised protein [Mycobacteroides abscessus subsp. abscessus]